MKRCVRRIGFLILFSLITGSMWAALSIDHDAGTVTSTNDPESWVYTLSSGSWTWDNGTNTWSYDASTKVWTDNDSGEEWKYDSANDLWVNTPDGDYDLSTATTFNFPVWRYDSDTKAWQFVKRTTYVPLVFDVITTASWTYNTTSSRWEYARTADDSWPNIPTSQEWTFATDATLRWVQTTPETGAIWDYTRATRHWVQDPATTPTDWQFRTNKNDEIVWQITGQEPSDSDLWDRVQWEYRVATGVWAEQEVKDAPLTYAPVIDWAYDTGTDAWYQEGVVDGVPDTGTTARNLSPLFPPTPFATQKAVIEDVITDLLAAGVVWGSVDGTGDGLVDVSNNSYITSGQFVFDTLSKLSFVDTVKLKGDLELLVKENGTLTVGDGSEGGDVIITPADDATVSQLIFNVEEGKTLEVLIKNDVSFLALDNVALFLSFRGRGTTVFRVPSGKVLTFGPTDPESGSKGVHLQVLMELLAADIAANRSQLVFAPWSYAQESGDGAVNTNQSQSTWLQLGRHSSLTFVSANEQGVSEDTLPGYGAVGFDVAHAGVGRTILDIAAGKVAGDMLDAGVNIYGNLITGSGDAGAVVAADFRTGVSHIKRAGIRAKLNIIDDTAFKSVVPDPAEPTTAQAATWVARDVSERRGLVILNHNKSYPRLLANLEQAATLQDSAWSQHTRPYHPGFILGNNGEVDVRHNLFLDYVAASTNRLVDPEFLAGTGKTTADVKLRNPSALIIDGIGTYAASTDTSYDMNYLGVKNGNNTHALITLRGSAGVFARCGASSQTGELVQAVEEVTVAGPDNLDATIGSAIYNGVFAPVLDSNGLQSLHESIALDAAGNPLLTDDDGVRCLDGEHAVDVEGPLTIKSILGRLGFAPNGYINIPSIRLDHTGAEILPEDV